MATGRNRAGAGFFSEWSGLFVNALWPAFGLAVLCRGVSIDNESDQAT
jgi:hypothetical protein